MGRHILALVGNDLRLLIYRCVHNDVYSHVRAEFELSFVAYWSNKESYYMFNEACYGPCRRDLIGEAFVDNNYGMIWGVSHTTSFHDRDYGLPTNYQYSNGSTYSSTCK
jgi:hypothetical protein